MKSASLLVAIMVVTLASASNKSPAGDKSIFNRLGSPVEITLKEKGNSGRTFKSPKLNANEKWEVNLSDRGYETTLKLADGSQVEAGEMDLSDPRKTISNLLANTTGTTVSFVDPVTGQVRQEVQYRTVYFFVYGQENVDPDGLRFGITFIKCEDGIHLKRIHENMPSQRCITADGTTLSLEVDDHILNVNGETIQNQQHMLDAVAASPREMNFTVLDRRTGKRLEMRTTLAW